MSTKVKWYSTVTNTGLSGFGNNTAGSFIALLRTILFTGFNSKTVTTITRTSTTVNVYVSTGHGYEDYQVILIEGATETEYNGEWTITKVDANNFTFQIATTPASPATGTITSEVAALNWIELYSDSNTLIVQQPGGTETIWRFYDPGTVTARSRNPPNSFNVTNCRAVEVSKVENVSGLSSYTEVGLTYIQKGQYGETAFTCDLVAAGDDKSLHLFTTAKDIYDSGGGNRMFLWQFFGDLKHSATLAQHPNRVVLVGKPYFNANTDSTSFYRIVASQTTFSGISGNDAFKGASFVRGISGNKYDQPYRKGDAVSSLGYDLGWITTWGSGRSTDIMNMGIGMMPWEGQQQITISYPVLMVSETAYGTNDNLIWGRVPGMWNIQWSTQGSTGVETLYPFAANGDTNRVALRIRGFQDSSSGDAVWVPVLQASPLRTSGPTYERMAYSIDITGPW